jgi:hypothetical protein
MFPVLTVGVVALQLSPTPHCASKSASAKGAPLKDGGVCRALDTQDGVSF